MAESAEAVRAEAERDAEAMRDSASALLAEARRTIDHDAGVLASALAGLRGTLGVRGDKRDSPAPKPASNRPAPDSRNSDSRGTEDPEPGSTAGGQDTQLMGRI